MIKIKRIILIGLILFSILLLVGCIDRNGMEVCKNSYDNLILKDDYKILYHQSDFLCCVENRYMVSYLVSNISNQVYLNDFIYDSEYDELSYYGDNEIVLDCI